MKILKTENLYAKNVHTVELGPEDEGKTNLEMVTAADNYGEYGKSICHFGGSVGKSADGKTATITVYID